MLILSNCKKLATSGGVLNEYTHQVAGNQNEAHCFGEEIELSLWREVVGSGGGGGGGGDPQCYKGLEHKLLTATLRLGHLPFRAQVSSSGVAGRAGARNSTHFYATVGDNNRTLANDDHQATATTTAASCKQDRTNTTARVELPPDEQVVFTNLGANLSVFRRPAASELEYCRQRQPKDMRDGIREMETVQSDSGEKEEPTIKSPQTTVVAMALSSPAPGARRSSKALKTIQCSQPPPLPSTSRASARSRQSDRNRLPLFKATRRIGRSLGRLIGRQHAVSTAASIPHSSIDTLLSDDTGCFILPAGPSSKLPAGSPLHGSTGTGSRAGHSTTGLLQSTAMISYSHSEGQQYARSLKGTLEELGVSCYLDLDEILLGTDWMDSLNEAIAGCEVFVALVTPSYGSTLWTARELKLADLLGKHIIPVNFGQQWPPAPLAIQCASLQYIRWMPSGGGDGGDDSQAKESFKSSQVSHIPAYWPALSPTGGTRLPLALQWHHESVLNVAKQIKLSIERVRARQSQLPMLNPPAIQINRNSFEMRHRLFCRHKTCACPNGRMSPNNNNNLKLNYGTTITMEENHVPTAEFCSFSSQEYSTTTTTTTTMISPETPQKTLEWHQLKDSWQQPASDDNDLDYIEIKRSEDYFDITRDFEISPSSSYKEANSLCLKTHLEEFISPDSCSAFSALMGNSAALSGESCCCSCSDQTTTTTTTTAMGINGGGCCYFCHCDSCIINYNSCNATTSCANKGGYNDEPDKLHKTAAAAGRQKAGRNCVCGSDGSDRKQQQRKAEALHKEEEESHKRHCWKRSKFQVRATSPQVDSLRWHSATTKALNKLKRSLTPWSRVFKLAFSY